jgi:4a-hydroxytetrahydrobiopterin dehydratase
MTLNSSPKGTSPASRKGGSPLSVEQARKLLSQLPGWKLASHAQSISKKFVMKDFSAGIALIKAVWPVAEAQDHHPDMHLTNYRNIRIVLSTHDVGGLSDKDFSLAKKIESLPKRLKADSFSLIRVTTPD